MTTTITRPASAELTPPRDRRSEEPRGRWENRCDWIGNLSILGSPWLICDRPTDHKGMHSGRLFSGDHHVIGYGRRR